MTKVRFYPFEDDYRLAFAVIYTSVDGQAVWCRHRDRETWELPGGHIEPGETASRAAKRELREETGATQFTLEPVCVYSVTKDGVETFGALFSAEILAFGPLEHEIAEIAISDNPPGEWTYPEIQPLLMKRVCGKAKSAAKRKPRVMKILAVAMAFMLMFSGFMLHRAYKDKQSWLWTNPVVRSLRVWNWHGYRDYQAALARLRRADRNAAGANRIESYPDGAGYWLICYENFIGTHADCMGSGFACVEDHDGISDFAPGSLWYVDREGAQPVFRSDAIHVDSDKYFKDERFLYLRTGSYDRPEYFAFFLGADGPIQLDVPDSVVRMAGFDESDRELPCIAVASGEDDLCFLIVRDGMLCELAAAEMPMHSFLALSDSQLVQEIVAGKGAAITDLLWRGNNVITVNLQYDDGRFGHMYVWLEDDRLHAPNGWGDIVICNGRGSTALNLPGLPVIQSRLRLDLIA